MSVIAIDHLTKSYGQRVGVEDLVLDVPEGSIFGFLGPNGSGKTTTIRVLLAFLKASAGRVAVFGKDCWREHASIKEEVGYVPGDLRLHSWMTGRDALSISGKARRRDLAVAGAQLAEYFELELDVPVRKMSRGMRQKLGLILACAHEPRLLILDEPTASLDPLTQQRLYKHLRDLSARGHTVFFSSHVLSEVESLCDRVAILRKGRLVEHQSLDELRRRAGRTVHVLFKTPELATYVTTPPILKDVQRHGASWDCMLDGGVPELLTWLSLQPIEDAAIGQPDLDSLFWQYYQEESENR